MPRAAAPGRSARAQPSPHSEPPSGLPSIPCRLRPEPRGPVQAEGGSGRRARKAESTGRPGQTPLTEQACPPSHLLSGEMRAADRAPPRVGGSRPGPGQPEGGPGDVGTPPDCGWIRGHSLVAREVLGNPSLGGCPGPNLHSTPRGAPCPHGRVQPHPHTQADRHEHTDHTQMHRHTPWMHTWPHPRRPSYSPRGNPPAPRLQGQGHPACSSHPSVSPTGPRARATGPVPAGQHTGKGSLTPRR